MRRVEINGSNGKMDLVLRTSRYRAAGAASSIGGPRISIDTSETKGSNPRAERFCTSSKTLLQTWPEQVSGAERALLVRLSGACLHNAQ
jgi:hypothetical protein